MDGDNLDLWLWTFIYLMLENPEKFLNNDGMLMYNIAEKKYKTITKAARDAKMQVPTMWEKLHRGNISPYVDLRKSGKKTSIYFKESIINDASEIINWAMKKNG